MPCLPAGSHSDPALVQYTALQHSAVLQTALNVSFWRGIMFHTPQDQDRKDNTTPMKKI